MTKVDKSQLAECQTLQKKSRARSRLGQAEGGPLGKNRKILGVVFIADSESP